MWDIYVINPDGSGKTSLTDHGQNSMMRNSVPTWSPDGLKIAFGIGHNIYVMNSDGPGQTLFITNGGDPDWAIKTPKEAVQDLITKVDGMGLPKGIEQSLLAKLNIPREEEHPGAIHSRTNTLKAFINEVNPQRGKALIRHRPMI